MNCLPRSNNAKRKTKRQKDRPNISMKTKNRPIKREQYSTVRNEPASAQFIARRKGSMNVRMEKFNGKPQIDGTINGQAKNR